MKTASKLFFFALMLMSTGAFADALVPKNVIPIEPVQVLPSQYQNLFVFKVARELKGAVVEVYYSNGDLVAAKSLAKRKMVINFCDVKSGTYTIRVKKNNRMEEFKYIRK